MEIAEVRDPESLEAYFDTLDDDERSITSRRVAFLAAARVFPVAFTYSLSRHAVSRDWSPASLFGALAVAGVSSTWPTPKIDRGLEFAAEAALVIARDVPNTVYHAINAISSVADAAVLTELSKIASATAVVDAFSVRGIEIWQEVRVDLDRSAKDPYQDMPALWQGMHELQRQQDAWMEAKERLASDTTTDWSFWILWYERIRAGRDFHAEKLAEILNPLREEDWKKGPAHINPLFDDLLALYREEDAALELEPTPLSQAVFADFTFDALSRVMVMIGIDNDTAHLRAPEVVQAFLDDSEELRDLLQDFADDARALSGGNYAGVLQRKAEKLLSEFRRAGETTHLRARIIVTYCGDLERHSQEEKARNDLGRTLSEDLDQRINLLKRLCMKHFGPAYLALAPLADMPRDHVDQHEVLRLLDHVLEQMRAPSLDGLVALDPEGVAVFEEMIRSLEDTRAAIAEADSEQFRDLLEDRFAQRTGSIGVTALRYFEKSSVAGARTAEALIKADNQVKGLQDIVNRLKDWLPEGFL